VTSIGKRYQEGLAEATRFFMGESNVQEAARRLEARLQQLGIPYAVAGGLAVVAHGHLRVTGDVDVLLTADGLQRFKDESLGRGWLERAAGGRRLRDMVCNVPIDVLVTGGCPGDGVPRGLTFPDPAGAAVTTAQGRVLSLPVLVELKLASGLWTRDRPRDLDDVIQLIRANQLPADLGQGFHEQLRSKYAELWDAAQHPTSES
jgi:hypothetical protein